MKKYLLVLLILPAFVLSACGSTKPSTTIDVTMAEFMYTPAEFSIPVGQEVTINASNNGAVVHEFIIMKLGQTVGTDFGDEDVPNIYWRVEVEPGKNVTATFTSPSEPGEYQVVCGTKGHYVAGMTGKLIVVAGR